MGEHFTYINLSKRLSSVSQRWLKGLLCKTSSSLFFLYLFFFTPIYAQEVQWANGVIAFSSQADGDQYSSKSILGAPDAATAAEGTVHSWIPRTDDSEEGEYIHVQFVKAMRIDQVMIAESANPGAIQRIYAFDLQNNKYLIYENIYPKSVLAPYRLFQHSFPLTDYDVIGIKLELKTSAVKGSNQLDAIGIANSTQINPFVETPKKEKLPKRQPLPSTVTVSANAQKLSSNVNSDFAERLPVISHDGQTLYFARKYHPQNIGEENQDDIWVSYREGNEWSKAVNVGAPLNNRDQNFVVAVDPSGNTLYLANDYKNSSTDAVSISRRNGRTWSPPKALNIENHYNDNNFIGYHISADGSKMFMAVERKEGQGSLDLYISFDQGKNNWSKPLNLGNTINTNGIENSVFLAADGKTLYFSSNGHKGLGGLDMFMTKRLDDSWTNWSKPVNLGDQINTPENDYNYTIPASGDFAYFASDDSNGKSNIYQIQLPEDLKPEPVLILSGKVINEDTGQPMTAELIYKSIGEKATPIHVPVKKNGSYQLILAYGENIAIHAEVNGFYPISENLILSDYLLEELDNDASFNSEGEAYAGYASDNKEVEDIRSRMNRVQEDIHDLELQRNKANFQSKGGLEVKGKIYRTELEDVERQYNDFANMEQSKGTYTKIESTEKGSDQELEEMKRKFNKVNKNDDPFGASDDDKLQDKGSSPNDSELDRMKQKFNKHYNKEERTTKTEETRDPFEDSPQDESIDNTYRSYADENFENFRDQIYKEMKEEHINKVRLNLINREFDLEKRKFKKNLTADQLMDFDVNIPEEVLLQLQRVLDEKIDKDQQFVSRRIEQKMMANAKKWELEKKLRKALNEEVNKDLEIELAESVGRQIRLEFTYHLKVQEHKNLMRQMNQKIQQQMKEEKNKKTNPTSPRTTKINTSDPNYNLVQEYKEIKKDFELVPVKIGQLLSLNNLFFEVNQKTLKPESLDELNRLSQFLLANPNVDVEIGGHTNGWCSHEFAVKLSEDRARTVANFLVEKGVPQEQVQFKGYGKTRPITENESKEGRIKNQRVELKIIDVK